MSNRSNSAFRNSVILSVVIGVPIALWFGRVRSWGGDIPIGRSFRAPMGIQVAEPLGAILSSHFHECFYGVLDPVNIVQLESWLLGLVGLLTLPFLWRRYGPSSLLLFAHVGFLFYLGYPEIGTPFFAAIIPWYVVCVMQGNLFASDILITVGTLCHGSLACWLAPHVWFRGRRFWVPIVVLLLEIAGIVAYARHFNLGVASGFPGFIGHYFGNISAPMRWIEGGTNFPFFSSDHFNAVLITASRLSPMGLLAAFHLVASADSWERRLAGSSILSSAFLLIVWYPIYGYYADWDLFSTWPFACGWAMMIGFRGRWVWSLVAVNLIVGATFAAQFYVHPR